MHAWLLPEYTADILPQQARCIEFARRTLLDLFAVHGYQYVIPPLLEYVESLTTGAGRNLDLVTFKVVDQFSGRLMGIRADITPQIARIDAHLLNNDNEITRLCYAGSTLRTTPDGVAKTREPIQVGAELYGFSGVAGDIEIQLLLSKALNVLGVKGLHIDLGHVGIFRHLIQRFAIPSLLEQDILISMQNKDLSTLRNLVGSLDITARQALSNLFDLCGDVEVLSRIDSLLPPAPEIQHACLALQRVATALQNHGVTVSIDLTELHGYDYHSGIVFVAYAPHIRGALAYGGRYDEVGMHFGRSRSATGFSLDLLGLDLPVPTQAPVRIMPAGQTPALMSEIEAMRAQGDVVIQTLSDD